jgi:hypothetical protein
MLPTTTNTTLEYFDGFDDYNTAQISRCWSSFWNQNSGTLSINPGTGRNGTSSLRMVNAASNVQMYALTTQATRTVGFAFKNSGSFNINFVIFQFLDGSTAQLSLSTNTIGQLFVSTGSTLGTSTLGLSINTWYYIEFSATINNTTGSFTVKVNGVTWLTVSGVNTRSTTNNSSNGVLLGGSGANTNCTFDYDDFYSRSDGIFCGDCRVESVLPTGNGATIQLTPLTGTNHGEVADNPADDDTSYNFAGSAGLEDEYTYPAISTTSGTVYAVMTIPVMRNDSAGTVTVEPVYHSGGNDYFGVPQNIGSTSYSGYSDIQGQNPATGAAWTIAGVNAAQYGIKRTV